MSDNTQRKSRYETKSGNYQTSKDYKHLKDLLNKGFKVVCFVDVGITEKWEYVFQHIALAYKGNLYYEVSSPGITYILWYEKQPKTFEQLCEENNVEYIEPNNKEI